MELPPELLFEVVGHLDPSRDKQTLKNICKANSVFRDTAQQKLFQDATLQGGLERTKSKLIGLTNDNCRLGKYIKRLTINGEAILTEDEMNRLLDITVDVTPFNFVEVEFHSKEFTTYLLTFLSALRPHRTVNGLEIAIDTDHEHFRHGDGWGWPEYGVLLGQILTKAVVVCFGYLDAEGLWDSIELALESSLGYDFFDWPRANPSDFCLSIDQHTPPGFNPIVFNMNMDRLRTATIRPCIYLDNKPASVWAVDFEKAVRSIMQHTGVTKLNLTMNVGSRSLEYEDLGKFSLGCLAGHQLACLNLSDARFSYDTQRPLQKCTGLREITLDRVRLQWRKRKYSKHQPWESVFLDLANLPLVKLQINKLHSKRNKSTQCMSRGDQLTFISEREEDFTALEILVNKILGTNGKVTIGSGTDIQRIGLFDDIPVCKHRNDYEKQSEQCPAGLKT